MMTANEVRSFLERYAILASEGDEARDKGDFAKVGSCQQEGDFIEGQLLKVGFIPHFDEGSGLWMLALRSQFNPENV